MSLSGVIKEARLAKNLKQEDAATAIGVTVQTLSKWENGKAEPKVSHVAAIAKVLGLSEREVCQGQRVNKLDLSTFLTKVSNASQNVTEVNKLMLLWERLENHEEFIDALHTASSSNTR